VLLAWKSSAAMWRILTGAGILRAARKRPAENGVDVVFAPLFWIAGGGGLGGFGLWGVGLWGATKSGEGFLQGTPLAWAYKPPAPSIRCWAIAAEGARGLGNGRRSPR